MTHFPAAAAAGGIIRRVAQAAHDICTYLNAIAAVAVSLHRTTAAGASRRFILLALVLARCRCAGAWLLHFFRLHAFAGLTSIRSVDCGAGSDTRPTWALETGGVVAWRYDRRAVRSWQPPWRCHSR